MGRMDNKLKNKKLLVLGGTQISCQIVHIARAMGCFVGVADYNRIEDSPGKQIADAAYDVSVTDIDAVVDLIQREHIDGVITGFADAILPAYAEICEKAGLPAYATKEQLETFTRKDRYKKILREYGIPTVEEYAVRPDDFEETVKDITYPVLVKPADSAGARGITICNSKYELRKAIEKALVFSKSGTVLVERYIEGREVTVNWLFKDGEYYLTGIANRHVKHNQERVIPLPVGYTYPASILPQYRAETEDKCRRMFRGQGIRNGMMFMQCKVKNGMCIVYDIGYRLTGTQEYVNLRAACGYDPMEMMIRFALTGSMGEERLAEKADPTFGGKYGFNVSCLAAPGTIKKITGREEVLKMDEVSDAVIAHCPGETITENMKGLLAQIVIRILGTVDRYDDLYGTMKKIEDKIHIISTEGKELKLAGIEPEDVEGYVLVKE